jgi:hypothetical protein
MIEFILLASYFKTGDFLTDIVFPSVAGAVVLFLIFNSFIGKWGYRLI